MVIDMFDCDVTNFTQNGKCSNCGQCCSNCLPLSSKEIKRIKAYIKKHKIKEQRHNAMTGIDMTCPFRDENNKKCLIYEIRPEICRQFMCNHNAEDIKRWKINFHKKFNIVFMRKEFFGSTEEADLMKYLFGGINESI